MVVVLICIPTNSVPQKQGKSCSNPPKPKRSYRMLNVSDRVNILGLLKGGMSVEVGQCYGKINQIKHLQNSMNFMHPEDLCFFFRSGLFGTIQLWIPRDCCI
jgi:hypothetical protein